MVAKNMPLRMRALVRALIPVASVAVCLGCFFFGENQFVVDLVDQRQVPGGELAHDLRREWRTALPAHTTCDAFHSSGTRRIRRK